MNKEIMMRKANYIRKDEINLCRFVEICYSVIERNIEGKWEYVGKEVTKHDCPLELLREQQKYMGLYLSILEKRALIENVEL